MPSGSFSNVKITHLCVALPTKKYSTEEIMSKSKDEKVIKRFIKSVGVENRYLSVEEQTTSDLCYFAANTIFEKNEDIRKEVDTLLFISQNPDYKRPSTAIILQDRLGLSKDTLAFDINLGCSGYVYGLYVAAGLISGGAAKKVLLLVGDVNRDLEGDPLFGDAGAATIIEQADTEYVMEGIMKSDGSGYTSIYTYAGGQRNPLDEASPDWESAKPHMDGDRVFEFTINDVPALFEEYKSKFKRDINVDYDYVILHQANRMMLKHIIRKVGINEEKAPFSIEKYGNVSSASVPLAIADLCETKDNLPSNIRLLMSGFGVGLSYGVISAEVVREGILPLIYTDYHLEKEDE